MEGTNGAAMIEKTFTLELVVPVSASNDEDAEDRLQRIIERIEDLFEVTPTIVSEETYEHHRHY